MQKIRPYLLQNDIPGIKKCYWYFAGLLLLLMIASILLISAGKAGSFLSLNSYHPFFLNVFFINYTFLGDGIFAVGLIAFLFYRRKKKKATAILLSFLLSGFIVQLIKNLVSAPRPKLFFEAGQYLYFIDGVSHGGHSSFPSGHTATAFAVGTVMILMIKNKNWQLPILAAAALVGYSRIYLAQHFLIDVMIGALIGSLTGVAAVQLVLNAGRISRFFEKIKRKKSSKTEQAPASIQTA